MGSNYNTQKDPFGGPMLGQNHLFGIFLGLSRCESPKYLIVFYDHPSFDRGYKFECIKTNQD